MKLEELFARYLPMNRLLSYLLLGLTEPLAKDELCQTISELSEGEFDDDPEFESTLWATVEELLHHGLIEELEMDGVKALVTTGAGSKLLICDFSRRHWLESEKDFCRNSKISVDKPCSQRYNEIPLFEREHFPNTDE